MKLFGYIIHQDDKNKLYQNINTRTANECCYSFDFNNIVIRNNLSYTCIENVCLCIRLFDDIVVCSILISYQANGFPPFQI